jgi:RHS repeat-associated protein
MGSIRQMTDASGTVQDTIAYDGSGGITSESSPTFGDRYKWTGRELDSASGLQLNGWRYYDPKIGRWTSDDPLGFGGGDPNVNRYVGNSTPNAIDPAGLETFSNTGDSAGAGSGTPGADSPLSRLPNGFADNGGLSYSVPTVQPLLWIGSPDQVPPADASPAIYDPNAPPPVSFCFSDPPTGNSDTPCTAPLKLDHTMAFLSS